MSSILLVEDDPDQLEIRSLLLTHAGHHVHAAGSCAEARRLAAAHPPTLVVMDLRLPRTADGVALIADLRALDPAPRIVVLTGWAADLKNAPEVDAVLAKPCRSRDLLGLVARLSACLLALLAPLSAATIELDRPAEVTAAVTVAAPGLDWQTRPGIADLLVDGRPRQQVMLYAGATRHRYDLFLGALPAGRHEVTLRGYPDAAIALAPSADPVLLHSPVLYERKNAVGRFTDIPLLTYAEWLTENGRRVLQYSVIFSNEDGGTSTRFLMARWGRTTDIEFVYKVYFTPAGAVDYAIIQGRGHRDERFTGPFEGQHPLLMPVTDNNMVAGEGPSPVRYQPAPVVADLSAASRELVMDQHPITWRVMIQELLREGKLREYGSPRGEDISDPRNYLFIEARIANDRSRLAATVRLAGESRWRTSDLGFAGAAIERDGWIRTTIELPPGTRPAQIADLGFVCLAAEKTREAGACTVHAVRQVFFLTPEMTPAPAFWSYTAAPVTIRAGEGWTWTLSSR